MKESKVQRLEFSRTNRHKVEADFEGGAVSSDGGLLLLREADRKTGFIERAARRMDDDRQAGKVEHDTAALIRQGLKFRLSPFRRSRPSGARWS